LGTYRRDGNDSITNILQRGKNTIEEIVRKVKSNYECIAIRAGGYNCQPSDELVKGMRLAGLKVDSSIYPGGHETGALSEYDYTAITNEKGYWYVNETLENDCKKKTDLIELPIASMPIARWRKYASTERIQNMLKNVKASAETFEIKSSNTKNGKQSIFGKVKYLLESEYQTWDYCLLSPSVHSRFINMSEQLSKSRDIFTLVGHPKSYIGDRGFNYLLKQLTKCGYRFTTISDIYNQIK
jgi:hypothetical protein